jgi:hypothetical protein
MDPNVGIEYRKYYSQKNQYEKKGTIFISYALVTLSLYVTRVLRLQIKGKQINVFHISRIFEKHACAT